MSDPKLKVEGVLKVNTYEVLTRAVEVGIQLGFRRSYKHTDKPSEDTIIRHIYVAVMEEISQVFSFGDADG